MNCTVRGARRGHAPGASRLFSPRPVPRRAGGSGRPPASTREPCPCPCPNPCPGQAWGAGWFSAPGTGEKIKETEDIGLGDPGIQNSGAGAAGSPQRRRADGGAAGTLEGHAGRRAPGPGRWEKSGAWRPGAGVPPLGISLGVGTDGGAHLDPRQGSEDSHLAQDGTRLGAARGTTVSRGPGHLWVPQEVEGRGHVAESGVFFGWW